MKSHASSTSFLTIRLARKCGVAPGLAALLILTGSVSGQLPSREVKGGFKFADQDESGKLRSLLSGDSVTNISNTELKSTGNVRLEIFGDEGKTNLIVISSNCLYNTDTKGVASPERLQATAGDGRFSIEGEGFEWRRTNASLTISNQVHATIRKDFLRSQTSTGTLARAVGRPVNTNAPADAVQLVHIFSDRFSYQSNFAVFEKNVRVEDLEGKMTCGNLLLQFSGPSREIDQILAEQDVVIESGPIRAAAAKAIYRLDGDSLHLTGNPTWQFGEQQGRADELFFDRKAGEFRADRNARMTLPAGALSGGFLPGRSPTPTNAGNAQPIEIFAEHVRLRPGATATNSSVALLRDNVRVHNPGGEQLRCGSMIVTFSAQGGRAEKVVAELGVVVEQGENRVAADRADYSGQTEIVVMTGHPTWQVQGQQGTGDVLTFDLKNRAYRAGRNVQMRLPPGAFGRSAWLLSGRNSSSAVAPTSAATNVANRPIEITADEFEFKAASGGRTNDVAIYRGQVRVSDPGRMNLTCGVLTGELLAGKNEMQSVVAEHDVEINIVDPGGRKQARGDRAVYSVALEELELTADKGVEIVMVEPAGMTRARGTKAIYSAALNVMRLMGDPRLDAPQGRVEGDEVILDRTNTTLRVTGNWKVKLPMEALKKTAKPPAPK